MNRMQSGILAPIPAQARYLEFHSIAGQDRRAGLAALQDLVIDESTVIGLGAGLLQGEGIKIDGHRAFPPLSGPGLEVPSTQADLWCWLRGDDRGEIAHAARQLVARFAPVFELARMLDGFRYADGLDLTGYEDGTENPEGDDAIAAAFVQSGDQGLVGSSFVAVQKWRHDLTYFGALPGAEQDDIIGRRKRDNEELADAPASAHVKRTAQEDFDPEAFVLRRSMPWADRDGEGLNFVAFGKSFDAFEAQMIRMAGLEDGITDALFRFSRAVTGAYYWCPPMKSGRLDLTLLGL